MKRYSEKQSYYGGYFFGKSQCLELTTNAHMIDGWGGLPVGFHWISFKKGFKDGWNEAKLLHQSKTKGTHLGSEFVKWSPFALKMLEAVENAQKVY